MIIKDLIVNVAILFIMMVPGFILKKCKLSTENFGKGLSNLVLYVAQPVLIFAAYVRPYDKDVLINSVYVLILSAVAHAVFALAAFALFKKAPDMKKRMLRFATIFSNAAFMGIPLISSVLGAEATIYASVYNIVFNLFLWSLGVKICTADRDLDGDGDTDADDKAISKEKSRASIKQALLHPVTIAAVLGLIVFVTPIDTYISGVSVIMDSLDMIKNLVAPLSMVVIGLRLADINFRGFFTDKYLYLSLSLRHIILPLVIVGVVRLLGLIGLPLGETVSMVTIIMAATPAASSATMFAEKYDCDAAYVSKVVAFSTIISILTMPLVLLVATL